MSSLISCRASIISSKNFYRSLQTSIVKCKSAVAAEPDLDKSYKVGDVIHGYKLERFEHIKELNITPYYLRHKITGSEHLHIRKDGDSNNVFAVSLRTTPKNSTGVAHILEHLALCGSDKFQVRDPFFKMTTRSLATFMNAMTGPDFTVYPFSTQNKKDFKNLLSVYVDAVFFPRLRPVDFRQEGWRLEHEKPDRKDTPIVLRGVVYNEMKGVFSSSSAIYSRHLLNFLFPDTTYKYESGGDPEHIPKLSHAELQKFHKLHYHPTNAKFFTYGNIPLENHLQLIDQAVMSKFSENPQAREQSMVDDQGAWESSKSVKITCPFDPLAAHPKKQTTTSISYVLPVQSTNVEEINSLHILSALLLNGPNAPFYKSLVESGIGADYSPSTGFGNYTKQPYFSVGLQGIASEDILKVQKIIEETFVQASKEGFDMERIDAELHNIELGVKHVSGNFGLRLIMNFESFWTHDGDVIDSLNINKHVEKFKQNLKEDNAYLSNLIDKYFIKNNHKLFLTMEPDQTFEEKRKEREKGLIEDRVSKLSEIDKQAVLYEGMELMNMQNSKDDPNILPCLEPSTDISKKLIYLTPLQFDSFKKINIQMCEQPTNEVVYFRALSDLSQKVYDEHLDDYLPLFCDVATKLGAGSFNRHEFAQKIQLSTGGLNVGLRLNPHLAKFDEFKKEISLSSYCLRKNVPKMFDMWLQVFQNIHFDHNIDYLRQLIKASAADLSEGIAHSGQSYAVKRATAKLTKLGELDERLSGLSYVARIKDMASQEHIEEIVEKLKFIATCVFDPNNIRCSINAEPDFMGTAVDDLKTFIGNAQECFKPKEFDQKMLTKPAYERTKVMSMSFPFATHFVGKSIITVPRLHKDFAKLVILNKLISSKFLLREVREKGGAYGAGARISNSGIMSFFSYRDPNTTKTLGAFNHSTKWITEASDYSDRDIEESKLGVFQDVDKPIEPGMRGQYYFLLGESDDMRQEYRKRLLDVSKKDVISMAYKYLKQPQSGIHVI